MALGKATASSAPHRPPGATTAGAAAVLALAVGSSSRDQFSFNLAVP